MSKAIHTTVHIRADKEFVNTLNGIAKKVNQQTNMDVKYTMPFLTKICRQLFQKYNDEVAMMLGEARVK